MGILVLMASPTVTTAMGCSHCIATPKSGKIAVLNVPPVLSYCAHMHCDVDLRSRRMWAASYRLTRLIMNEDSHVPRGPDTGRERVLRRCCCGRSILVLSVL